MKGFWLAAGMLCAGCAAVLPTPTVRRSSAVAASSNPALQGLRDVRGALHVHSRYSHDGTTPIGTIARIAQQEDLDFLFITDHNNLNGKREERLDRRPLILVGTEISTTGGYLLALFIEHNVPNDQPVDQIVAQIHAQGGLAIVSDPPKPKRRWTRWDLPIDGLAIYDLNNALLDDAIPWLLLKAAIMPNPNFWHTMRRRPETMLAVWDQQLQRGRPLVGIGSHDTHAHAGVKPFLVDSFQSGFRFMTTHVLVSTLTREGLAEGIRRGRCYVGFDGITDPRPFLFALRRPAGPAGHPTEWALMGDEVAWQPGLTAVIQIPQPGTIRLFDNGEPLRSTVGTDVEWPIEHPGVYRLEIFRRDRPWILSNPIYVEDHPS